MFRQVLSLAVFASLVGGCAASLAVSVVGAVTVSRPPPEPPSATRDPGPVPYDGAVWAQGVWEWDGLQFVWVDGYWVGAGAGELRQPRWVADGDRWTFLPGAVIDASGETRPLPAPPRGGGGASGIVIAVPEPKAMGSTGSDQDLDLLGPRR